MKALIQRVSEANVTVNGETIGEIERGLLVFLGVEKGDDGVKVKRLMERLSAYRVFSDSDGKMNCSVTDIGGSVLLVSQFTLAADTKKGLRPGFSTAAEPAVAERLYNQAIDFFKNSGLKIATGKFGADMKVSLVNDGPVTFMLEL